MPGRAATGPFGISDPTNVRAVAVIGPNTRVKGAKGKVGTALDVVIFPGAFYPDSMLGLWIVPNTRVAVGGVPTVGATSQGLAFSVAYFPGPITIAVGPMSVPTPDPKLKNT